MHDRRPERRLPVTDGQRDVPTRLPFHVIAKDRRHEICSSQLARRAGWPAAVGEVEAFFAYIGEENFGWAGGEVG